MRKLELSTRPAVHLRDLAAKAQERGLCRCRGQRSIIECFANDPLWFGHHPLRGPYAIFLLCGWESRFRQCSNCCGMFRRSHTVSLGQGDQACWKHVDQESASGDDVREMLSSDYTSMRSMTFDTASSTGKRGSQVTDHATQEQRTFGNAETGP